MDPLSRLVNRPLFESLVSKGGLPLITAAYGPNGAISLTKTFNGNLSDVRAVLIGNKILSKNLDLAQDFPKKLLFHFLWVKMLPKNSPKIFRWPEMCPLGKILAKDFEIAAFTKILGQRDKSIVPLIISTESCKTLQTKTHTTCTAMTAMQR